MHVCAFKCTHMGEVWGLVPLNINMPTASRKRRIFGKVLRKNKIVVMLLHMYSISGKNEATSLKFCCELTSWYKVWERIRKVLAEGETWALCLTTSDGTLMRHATCKRAIQSGSNSFCCLHTADAFGVCSQYRNLRNQEIIFVII